VSTSRYEVANQTLSQRLIRFFQFNPAFVAAVLLVISLAILWSPERPESDFPLDRVVEVKGWVSRAPETRDNSIYFELSPESICQQEKGLSYSERIGVWVSSGQEEPENFLDPPLQYGEVLRFRTYLKQPSFYAVPGVQDHRWLAWLQGAPLRVSLKSPSQLERLGKNWIGTLTSPFFQYLWWFETHSQKVLSERTFRLLLGVFLGRKRSLDESEKDSIRDLGLLHLFVVSGFHISLIVVLLHYFFRVLGRSSFLATISGVWLYILAIGFPLAAVRAGIIASLTYLLVSYGLQRGLLNCLGISALVIAFLSPRSVFSASFHLSYICLCAIGILALPCMKYVRAVQLGIEDFRSERILLLRSKDLILRRRIRFYLEQALQFVPPQLMVWLKKPLARIFSYTVTLLLCSLCIQLLLFPIAVHYTNRWSWFQALSNLVLMPLFSLLIGLCFLFFLTFWSPAGPLISGLLGLCSDLSYGLIERLASKNPVAFLPHPRFWEILIYLMLSLVLLLSLPRMAKALTIVVPLFLLLSLRQPGLQTDKLVITMLDVGQSESMHLHYPNGKDALIDTGGLPYPARGNFVGERLVSRYLWHLRVRDLLYILITHPDIDHKKGYSFVRKAFSVKSLLYSEPQPDYKEPKRQVFGGQSFSIAGVNHLIYHPDKKDLEELSRNEASVVLRLEYGKFSMLFTGDIEEQGEHQILFQLAPVTALKVAHHGSDTSSSAEFLNATRPKIAMISAGRNHYFDHPSQSVLNRLRKGGALVLSTKKDGSLRLITDGSSWKAQRYSILTRRFEDLFEETISP